MRKFTDSDIFLKMNAGNAIYDKVTDVIKSITPGNILNTKLTDNLSSMASAYRDTMTAKVIDAVKSSDIIIVAMPLDKRFPANIPYIRIKRMGKDCVVIDISRYATVVRENDTTVTSAKCDISKLYNMLTTAYISLKVLDGNTVLSSETIKWMSLMWAKMFNKVLMAQKVFVGNTERYEAFMYFAMRFFMAYYIECPAPIIEKISMEYIHNNKSKYIVFVENNLAQKEINLYEDWSSFARSMFSNEITNIRVSLGGGDINVESYIRLFSSSMGRDGAYLALWSVEYFFYCLFVTYNRAYILNDRNWEDIVLKDKKIMPKVLNAIYKEI